MSNPQSSEPPAVVQSQVASIPSGASTFLVQFVEPVQSTDAILVALAWEGTATLSSITDTPGDSFIQILSTNYTSGSQINIAIWGCLSSKGGTPILTVNFSATPTAPTAAIIDVNGSTNAVSLDMGGSGTATFTTSPPNNPIVKVHAAYSFECHIALLFAPTASSMTPTPGWTAALNSGTVGVFFKSIGDLAGVLNPHPAVLNAAVDSALAVVGLASLNESVIGYLFAPLFPDTFAPRLADQLYDSLQGDPTFVPNPYGPQPQLNT